MEEGAEVAHPSTRSVDPGRGPKVRHALTCRDERLTVSVGSHPVSRGVLVDGPTLLVSLLADAPNSEEPTVVRCAVRLFVRRVLL